MKNSFFSLFLIAAFWAIVVISCGNSEYLKDYSVEKVAVTGVTLDNSSQELLSGYQFTLTATVEPAEAYKKEVRWASDNPNVATVIGGIVTAKSAGTSIITATTIDGAKTASCTVTVPVVFIESVTLPEELTLVVGESVYALTFTAVPAHASNKNVTWKTNRPNIAEVDENGVVTPKSRGIAIITLTTEDGKHTAICRVTVLENLLKNGGCENPKSLNTALREWTPVPSLWFRDYYANDPVMPGQGLNYNQPFRCSLLVPTYADFFKPNGSGAFFLNSFTGAWMGILGDQSSSKSGVTGGLYQLVDVSPGKYRIGATIGFRCDNGGASIKRYETVKILSPDGMTTYHADTIKTTNIKLYNNRATCIVKVEGTVDIQAGLNTIRFQIDQRSFLSPNVAPVMLFDDLLLARLPE